MYIGQITRRGLVMRGGAVAGASMLGYSRKARSADFAYKFGHGFPNSHPFHTFLTGAVEKIKQESNGRVDIAVYGNNQLGGDTQMLSQVRSGAIQFFEGGGIILSILVPEAAISGMGFAFKNYDVLWPTLDGDLGAYIRGGFDKVGLHAFEKMWDNGFRQISSSTHPIRTPDDLKGFKIRVPPGQLYTSLFKALGAAPTSVNLAETYSALQTRIVEGQENPLVVFDTAKYAEVQKYISMTSHIWDGTWLIANGAAWQAMPIDMQDIVSRNFNAAGERQRATIAKTNADLEGQLAAKGVIFNTPDQAPFRAILQKAGFYQEWAGKFGGGWAILEKSVGKLA